MQEEQLKAFLEAVKADAGLQEKFKAAADADAVVAIAKEAGFVVSAEELEGVAGGQVVGNGGLIGNGGNSYDGGNGGSAGWFGRGGDGGAGVPGLYP